ncbi:hypothetical protein CLOP_g10861 [Closterium sp. NIES-67]|nr:hypothetical protein CLOP_g10861 [Closterium sp. NIES-67]
MERVGWAPEALKALADLLAFHVATAAALNAAAIAAQYAEVPGNLTTLNGQGLWINYNASEKAALLNAYSPGQRALISEGVSVGYDGTVYYPNGTVLAANGTVIFDSATSPISVDSDGNVYYANGTIVSANGTVVSNGTAPYPGQTVDDYPPDMTSEAWVDSDGNVLYTNGTVVNANGTVVSNGTLEPSLVDPVPAELPPLPPVDPIPVDMGGGMGRMWGGGMGGGAGWGAGMGGQWGNWSAEAQQQWWGKVEAWLAQAVPGLNVSADDYLAWLNGSSYGWAAGSGSMWKQAGSDMNVARVVRADLMDSAGVVVHGVDGVLFPHFRDLPVFDKGKGGGVPISTPMPVPMPISVPIMAPNGSVSDGGNGTTSGTGAGATNGTADGALSDQEAGGAAGSAGVTAGGGASNTSSSSSSSSGSSADSSGKSTPGGTSAAAAGSPPPSGSQDKAGAAGLSAASLTTASLVVMAFSLVALL